MNERARSLVGEMVLMAAGFFVIRSVMNWVFDGPDEAWTHTVLVSVVFGLLWGLVMLVVRARRSRREEQEQAGTDEARRKRDAGL